MDILLDNSFGRVVFNNEDIDKVYINNELVWANGEKITVFRRITDPSELRQDNEIIFVQSYFYDTGASTDFLVMGGQDSGSTNSSRLAIPIVADEYLINDGGGLSYDLIKNNEDITVFKIEESFNAEDESISYLFYDENEMGYLYPNNGYIRTKEVIDESAKWIIKTSDDFTPYFIQIRGEAADMNTLVGHSNTGGGTFRAIKEANAVNLDFRAVYIYKKVKTLKPE